MNLKETLSFNWADDFNSSEESSDDSGQYSDEEMDLKMEKSLTNVEKMDKIELLWEQDMQIHENRMEDYDFQISTAISCKKVNNLKINYIQHVGGLKYAVHHCGGGLPAVKTSVQIQIRYSKVGDKSVKTIIPHFESPFLDDITTEVFSIRVAKKIKEFDYVCSNIQRRGFCRIGKMNRKIYKCGKSKANDKPKKGGSKKTK